MEAIDEKIESIKTALKSKGIEKSDSIYQDIVALENDFKKAELAIKQSKREVKKSEDAVARATGLVREISAKSELKGEKFKTIQDLLSNLILDLCSNVEEPIARNKAIDAQVALSSTHTPDGTKGVNYKI